MNRKTAFSLFACLCLSLLGLLGNWFGFELFFNVDFLLGSFFVMLAILLLGEIYGVIAGFIAATCTYYLWNHPWAIIIMTGEAIFVAFRVTRRNGNPVISDMLYWGLIGMPLVYLFYHHVMAIQMQSTLLIMLKQAVNGVFNSLLATIAFLFLKPGGRSQPHRIPYSHAIFVTMVSLVLLPAMLFLVIGMRLSLDNEKAVLAEKLSTTSEIAQKSLANWIRENHLVIRTLSTLVGNPDTTPVSILQHYVETFKASSMAFFRMGVINEKSISIAYMPLEIDGKSTIGVDFSERSYIPRMKENKQPYIPDVVMGKLGKPIPVALLLSPIVIDGEYKGYAAGVIDISEISGVISRLGIRDNLELTLVDSKHQVIASSHSNLNIMDPFLPPYPFSDEMKPDKPFHWIPEPRAGTSIMQRWRTSLLIQRIDIIPECNWEVIVEAPFLPVVEKIFRFSIKGLGLLALVTVFTVILSHLFSNGFVSAIKQLRDVTKFLPDRLTGDIGISWPESRIIELDALCKNFKGMALALTASFKEQNSLNETLESRVKELRLSREQLRTLASRLQAAREEERIGVAREIHDVLAQELTRLKFDLVWIQRRLIRPGDGLETQSLLARISEMSEMTNTAIRSVQKIATELRPAVLDSLGLCAAVEWQARDFQSRSGISCRATVPEREPPLGKSASTAIFRILQESLTNVLRHSGATRVDILLQQEGNQLLFIVRDNGCGISPDAIGNAMSIGLTGIRERALLLGGRFEISGQPEYGTIVEIFIPLSGNRDVSKERS
jgi:signal transduction histidine kinase